MWGFDSHHGWRDEDADRPEPQLHVLFNPDLRKGREKEEKKVKIKGDSTVVVKMVQLVEAK